MDIRDIAVAAATEAGGLLKGRFGSPGKVEFKGAVDLVTEMDRLSEQAIVSRIKSAFPGHGILTEESPEEVTPDGARWIIDPIDGTTNYAHAFPVFCVSIALERDSVVECAVVYNPMLDELFVAEKGRGATLNGKRISVSKTPSLDRSLLATGFPYDIRTSPKNNLDNFARFAVRAQAIRRAGSAALDLCYTACGRFDGFWEMKLRPWDVAAASLIVNEAGGRMTSFSGGDFSIYSSECLASNALVHEEMLSVLNERKNRT